jgi:hypothetical protein
MLSQTGAAKALNMDAFIEDLLRSFGKEDVERYFLSQPPAVPGAAAGGPPQQGGPPEQNNGVTGPNSIDPSVSPSATVSQSPDTMLQRLQALTGGGQNVQSS